MREDILKLVGIIIGVVIVVITITVLVIMSITGDKEDEDNNVEIDEGELVEVELKNQGVVEEIPEDMVDIAMFYDEYYLTDEEEETIVKERIERYVDPYEHDNRLYVFYDRHKPGSEVLIEVVEEYIKEENIPYTVYHMNHEEGLVFGTEVLEELGYYYDVDDDDGYILVRVKDKEIDLAMKPSTFSEMELKGE